MNSNNREKSEVRINIRVNKDIKEQAEHIFDRLGINMSSGINLYLHQVIATQSIPFSLEVPKEKIMRQDLKAMEDRIAEGIDMNLRQQKAAGVPIARYDADKGVPYLEHPDGRKEYKYNG